MFIVLKICASNDGKTEYDSNCFFTHSKLVVSNVIVPVNDKSPVGLFKNDRVSDFITFPHQTLQCWCGCNENNWIRFTIVDKKVVHKITNGLGFQVTSLNDYTDSDTDDNDVDSYYDSDSDDVVSKAYIDDFPLKQIVDGYGKYTYDSHWDCYCKTRSVCGCGCDSDHDGW